MRARFSTLLSLAALLLGLVFPSGRAFAATPVLTILFTGNTDGNYEPCPS